MLRKTLIALTLLAVPAVANGQDVKVDFDKAFDFTTVKTYSIAIGNSWGNNLGERRALAEFDEVLTAKGWKKVAAGAQPNVVVILNGATTTKHESNTFYTGPMMGYRYGGWGGMGMGAGTATTVVNSYKVGTLVVDIFDAKTKNLVFRGTAEDELSDKPEKNVKKLERASAKMFKAFPPKAKQ